MLSSRDCFGEMTKRRYGGIDVSAKSAMTPTLPRPGYDKNPSLIRQLMTLKKRGTKVLHGSVLNPKTFRLQWTVVTTTCHQG